MSDSLVPVTELLRETLDEWREIVARDPLGRFDARAMVKPWLAGLKSAGVKDAHQAKLGSRDSWAVLPFVIELPCPFGHRTIDRQRIGLVRLIVEDDGWVTLTRGEVLPIGEQAAHNSPFCWQCTADGLAGWLLTCSRCVAGEDSDEHHAGHTLWEVASAAPFTFVLFEFDRAMHVAEAAWIIAHLEDELDRELDDPTGAPLRMLLEGDFDGLVFDVDEYGMPTREALRAYLLDELAEYLPKPGSSQKAVTAGGASKPLWTDAEVIEFLEKVGVPADATVRAAWAIVGPMPQPRPSKTRVEEVQPKRKTA